MDEFLKPIAFRVMDAVPWDLPVRHGSFPVTRSDEQTVLETHQLKLRFGEGYWIELGFDGESQGKQIDFRPELPLIITW